MLIVNDDDDLVFALVSSLTCHCRCTVTVTSPTLTLSLTLTVTVYHCTHCSTTVSSLTPTTMGRFIFHTNCRDFLLDVRILSNIHQLGKKKKECDQPIFLLVFSILHIRIFIEYIWIQPYVTEQREKLVILKRTIVHPFTIVPHHYTRDRAVLNRHIAFFVRHCSGDELSHMSLTNPFFVRRAKIQFGNAKGPVLLLLLMMCDPICIVRSIYFGVRMDILVLWKLCLVLCKYG